MARSPLPQRLQNALTCRDALQQEQIYFAPVRHHSPACSYALRQLITQIKPTHVLIEAPASFSAILEELLNNKTQPPIAILCQTDLQLDQIVLETNDEYEEDDTANMPPHQITRSAFYPFCSYSPEWQAIQLAKQYNAKIQFIDLPWAEQVTQEFTPQQSKSLLSETYLKHSQYITQLAKKLHCRDHDEVWEHLFELRNFTDLADWQTFFEDTFIWCAMARLDYDSSSLEAEGSSQREQHMLTAIGRLKKSTPDAKIVVVTGGFHTLALFEGLWQNKLVLPKKSDIIRFNRQQKSGDRDRTWLIRYSFDRLDALNGYTAGMNSPAYYQESWLSMLAYEQNPNQSQTTQGYRQAQALAFLSAIADKLRKKQSDSDAIGFIPLKSAIEQACLLAELRGHYGPGRYDLLDGMQSAFIKGSIHDVRSDFWQIVYRSLSGNQLGQIPDNIASPPLVNQVYATLKQYRFKLDDTLPKITHIDIYRKPEHRQRSRFLHLLAFLDVGFANRLDGPNYQYGTRLTIMFEDWQYLWTPMVEARLIELSEQGTQLEQIALQKLQQSMEQLTEEGTAHSCQSAVKGGIQAALMGLQSYFTQLLAKLSTYLDVDNNLLSVVNCGHRLLYLWQGRDFLALNASSTLLALLAKVLQQAFFLLDALKQPDTEQQQENLKTLLLFRNLINNLPEQLDVKKLKQDFYLNLYRLQPRLNKAPLICGAIDSIAYLDCQISQSELDHKIKVAFDSGAQYEQASCYFMGIMQCAPELIIHSSQLLTSLDELLAHWEQEQFIKILPDLRLAFTQLTPKQNAMIAEKISKKYNAQKEKLSFQQYKFSDEDLQKSLSLELSVCQHIEQQQLQDWFKQ
ncbi:DUF5682 family protein [Gilliamella sp. Pas-s25]|uniref:DUF5682 family protein n=1 Tax=Gilliamella sp. Pas-s25 TaxID=2687310 RepID=UPI00135E16B0|nr:DUF5682 family protein [Gilliamella sp. Pas-s25]MWP61641.1 4-aminobutyrate aminotransferase [Gilliamella sp. Pas-s25]